MKAYIQHMEGFNPFSNFLVIYLIWDMFLLCKNRIERDKLQPELVLWFYYNIKMQTDPKGSPFSSLHRTAFSSNIFQHSNWYEDHPKQNRKKRKRKKKA